jgi:hypothetical protein
MKLHTTNYFDTFIEIAEDTKVNKAMFPKSKEKKTIAAMQFDLISKNPYQYTSDDVFFQVHAEKNDLTKSEYPEARKRFFSKGQPCFRASPLTKTHGYGLHCDKDGKLALYAMESIEYQKFVENINIVKVKAMKSKR